MVHDWFALLSSSLSIFCWVGLIWQKNIGNSKEEFDLSLIRISIQHKSNKKKKLTKPTNHTTQFFLRQASYCHLTQKVNNQAIGQREKCNQMFKKFTAHIRGGKQFKFSRGWNVGGLIKIENGQDIHTLNCFIGGHKAEIFIFSF